MVRRNSLKTGLTMAIVTLLLGACGGGGGGGGGDSTTSTPSATTIASRGTITGFGSVFVNGVEFHTNSASISVDDNPGVESDLQLGMVVTVSGTLNDDSTATATTVVFDDELQGPVSNLVLNADATTKTFTVFGITVVVDRVTTVLDDTPAGFNFDTLANDDVVEVSGFYDGSAVLNATYIEKQSDLLLGSSEVEFKGTVANAGTNSFTVDGLTVTYDPSGVSTDLTDLPSGVTDGIFVEVKGILISANTIQATRIQQEDNSFDDTVDKISVEGIITDFVDDSNFRVAGVPVSASAATFTPTSLTLANGLKVEAEGPMSGGVLQAIKVESRAGEDIKIEATVAGVSSQTNSITLDLINGTVNVLVDSRTLMVDDTSASASMTLLDLRTGDFLMIRGMLDDNGNVLASQVQRDVQDDVIMQGPVESFVDNVSITILGVTLFTSGAQFEDVNDSPIASSADFYNQLTTGALVKMKDAQPGDGTADEVEFEN